MPIRFWTTHIADSSELQLIGRCDERGVNIKNIDSTLPLHPCTPAIILVASVGYGIDQFSAAEVFGRIKSAGRPVISIVLKPFIFEGLRRQEEASGLISKLKEYSSICIVVEAVSLLETETETETLADALEGANNFVLLTISLITLMTTGNKCLSQSFPGGGIKEISSAEVGKLFESHGEATVGFGSGCCIESAILQSASHSPLLHGDAEELSCVVLSISSGSILSENDVVSSLGIFRQITGYSGEIILCNNISDDVKQHLFSVSLMLVCCSHNMDSQREGFLSSLISRIPVLSSMLGRHLSSLKSVDPLAKLLLSADDQGRPSCSDASEGRTNHLEKSSDDKTEYSRESNHGSVSSHGSTDPSFWHIDAGFHFAQLWARQRSILFGGTPADEHGVFRLPVGVRSTDIHSKVMSLPKAPNMDVSYGGCGSTVAEIGHQASTISSDGSGISWKGHEGTDLDSVINICNSAVTLFRGSVSDNNTKQRPLAARAASMLESERVGGKTWTPIVEFSYRGGTYRGRCQEGLPDGKGRLLLRDGSFYDGLWRNGKKSGLGMFCYCNGDVFHGTWRDDLMHGKGWFYFHGGDRWFANFWKGKANGEGRFYSKDGSIFFGQFQNGWRHGESIWIDSDGLRWLEVWDEGVLISRTKSGT